MATYKTPGVYVEEIPLMPPSVAEVETAIPAFIGFTEKGPINIAKRITSMKEYEESFGFAETEESVKVTIEEDGELKIEIDPAKKSNSVMYYALKLYFNNGGGPCYIVSVGPYNKNGKGNPSANTDTYKAGLEVIEKEDEPTLLVFPDAPFSLKPNDYYSLMGDSIAQCTKLKDRFAIVDVLVVDNNVNKSTTAFRKGIAGSESINLKYAAAYFPYLNTNLRYEYSDDKITSAVAKPLKDAAEELRKKAKDAAKSAKDAEDAAANDASKKAAANKARDAADEAEKKAKEAEDKAKGTINDLGLSQVELAMNKIGVLLTPCAAMAGVYASVDNARGVWKAPANVGLSYVESTTVKITDDDQKDMNVDVTDGKSVNAIRPFAGKGIKVWGARTLSGNDNEWRYINVRRFFNMVEESVKKSTYWAVFEPNDANTWVKVRAMIENYLLVKWKEGALAGAKPDEAFYVRVGLNQTMTSQDILTGIMNIEIGMAVVRPAEFIVLKFYHKLQVS